jgi:hypothetical protein
MGPRPVSLVLLAAELALGVALLGACAPPVSTVVVGVETARSILVRTNDDLSPGDVVFLWHRFCSSRSRVCRLRAVARGIVATVIDDSPGYALVELPSGVPVAPGDRASKESPMSPWHLDAPAE